jgi:hypothetical protein
MTQADVQFVSALLSNEQARLSLESIFQDMAMTAQGKAVASLLERHADDASAYAIEYSVYRSLVGALIRHMNNNSRRETT